MGETVKEMNQTDLEKLAIVQKAGTESLSFEGKNLSYKLSDFWQWSVSDIVSNATRGRFAEFIVATALGIDLTEIRDEWSAWDLEFLEPKTSNIIKIEIKSASYVQSWSQKDYSKISFSIKASRYWDSSTNKQHSEASRHADVYVFCLLKHKDKKTIEPLNLDQWDFYVASTKTLDNYTRSRHSITLKSLTGLTEPVNYDQLKETIIEKYKIRL